MSNVSSSIAPKQCPREITVRLFEAKQCEMAEDLNG